MPGSTPISVPTRRRQTRTPRLAGVSATPKPRREMSEEIHAPTIGQTGIGSPSPAMKIPRSARSGPRRRNRHLQRPLRPRQRADADRRDGRHAPRRTARCTTQTPRSDTGTAPRAVRSADGWVAAARATPAPHQRASPNSIQHEQPRHIAGAHAWRGTDRIVARRPQADDATAMKSSPLSTSARASVESRRRSCRGQCRCTGDSMPFGNAPAAADTVSALFTAA